MHITLIEPFFTGSHQQWAEGLQKFSKHEVQILSLKGKHWKWRMFGGAVVLAKQFREKVDSTDLILASDMLDLTTFLALTKKETHDIKTAIYFHENQLTYPWSPTDKDVALGRNNEYAFINYASSLAADHLFFNSTYHLKSFNNALPDFLRQFPDYNGLENVISIKNKSSVLHLGMDLKRFDDYVPFEINKNIPSILWNHRWEYDKNPGDFFEVLFDLKNEGIDFQLIVLGQKYIRSPKVFDEAKKILDDCIIHFGYADSFEEYARWLKIADILPVTSNQDFFGGSVVEAIYCGAFPLLPNRLAYPEHILYDSEQHFYDSKDELKSKLKNIINNYHPNSTLNFRDQINRYDWQSIIKKYDLAFEQLL